MTANKSSSEIRDHGRQINWLVYFYKVTPLIVGSLRNWCKMIIINVSFKRGVKESTNKKKTKYQIFEFKSLLEFLW